MKTFLISMLACGIALAQTPPAPKSAAPPAKKAMPVAGPDLLKPSTLKARAPEAYKVKFTTTKGDVVGPSHAILGAHWGGSLLPILSSTASTKMRRFSGIIPGFVAQFGIPARPDVAAAWDHAYIVDDRVTQSNKRGTLTFATAGPNTRTTQIFINYGDNARLDAQGFAPFGEVIDGLDIADKFFAGYGESPDQGRITAFGKAYLDKSFPNLDRIVTATVMPADAAAADAKK